ncbi:MAG: hypothetical protein ABIZ81_16375 [Opitutaceae bacterium]
MPANHRALQYAAGFPQLGAGESETVVGTDRFYAEVWEPLLQLNWQEKRWSVVVLLARLILSRTVSHELPWLVLAGAFREMEEVQQAREVLLNAERHHGKTCAILHFNLACYSSLVGKQEEAAKSLSNACRMEPVVRHGVIVLPETQLSTELRSGQEGVRPKTRRLSQTPRSAEHRRQDDPQEGSEPGEA